MKDNMKSYTTDGKVVHLSKNEEVNDKLTRIIGGKFREYRNLWDKVNNFEKITDFPLFLQLDMNQECNFSCPHCIVGDKKVADKYYNGSPLTWDQYKNIIVEGEEHGCPSVSVQGNNEPLLIKDLEKYIKFASSHSFLDIMMNSNASALTEARAKKILDSGLTRLRFSIDAYSEEVFNKIRIGGRYSQVIRNIEIFLDLKEKGGYELPIVGVSFCLQKDNEHEKNDFIDFWKDKVDTVSIQKYVPPVLEPGYDKFYTLEQLNNKKEFKGFKCPQPFQRVTIRNSEITPCCAMFSSRIKIGDVSKDTIYNSWNSEKMKELRHIHENGEWYKNDICRMCVNLIYPESVGKFI
jgi:radical SAM protein with 4Fe4S-binding SPASM domain